jgi:hypothetical protein
MILKTRNFARWARETGLADSLLDKAVLEIGRGLLEADLGGGILKKRIALPGRGKRGSIRTLLATNRNDRWFLFLVLKRTNVRTFQIMNWNL